MYTYVQLCTVEVAMVRPARTRRVGAATARQTFSQLLSDVRTGEQPVIIEKSGVPVAALVPLSMLEQERRWAEERAERRALLERLRRPFKDVAPVELEREAAAAVAAVRRGRGRKRTLVR